MKTPRIQPLPPQCLFYNYYIVLTEYTKGKLFLFSKFSWLYHPFQQLLVHTSPNLLTCSNDTSTYNPQYTHVWIFCGLDVYVDTVFYKKSNFLQSFPVWLNCPVQSSLTVLIIHEIKETIWPSPSKWPQQPLLSTSPKPISTLKELGIL